MAEEMPSWRSLASAASRSFKGYVSQRDPKRVNYLDRSATANSQPPPPSFRQAWGQWAGQKLRGFAQGAEATQSGIEKLAVFPGWAARRYRTTDVFSEDAQFDVEVFISGFSSRVSGPGFGTRAGKTFLRLAKKYAALPKLVPSNEGFAAENSGNNTPSGEELLDLSKLPPRPDEITEESELKELERQLQDMEVDNISVAPSEASMSSKNSSSSSVSSSSNTTSTNIPLSNDISDTLQNWHANLEARLHPFWSSALSNRTVRLAIFAQDPQSYDSYKSPPLDSLVDYDEDDSPQRRPIAMQEVQTAADGSFQVKLRLRWEDLCVHPGGVHVAFGDPGLEHELFVQAQLLPPPSRPSTPASYSPYNNPNSSSSQYFSQPRNDVTPTVVTSISVTLTNSTVRLISDIDDTVKLSGVVQGARALFQNVFVKDLAESVIPGMGDWYTSMWKRGVRFHYVSNGPFELLPVVNEFLQLSRLPPGSIKLRSYAGRSLFNGLLSAPAERKRQGIADVLDSFPESRFFLVGDSGEQDLELYASLAKERPGQILAIFIRDAGGERSLSLEDPTGEEGKARWWGWNGNGNGNGSGRSSMASSPTKTSLSEKDGEEVNGGPEHPRLSPTRSLSDLTTPRQRPPPQLAADDSSPSPTPRAAPDSRSRSQTTPSYGYPYLAPNGAQGYRSRMTGALVTEEPESMNTPIVPGRGSAHSLPQPSTRTPTPSYPPPSSRPHPPNSSNSNQPKLPSLSIPPQVHTRPGPPSASVSSTSYTSFSSFTRTSSSRSSTLSFSSRTNFYSSNSNSNSGSGSGAGWNSQGQGQGQAPLSEPEKRQSELQMRVYRARMEIPGHIPLRVFRTPEECFENAESILDGLHLGGGH